MLVPAPCTHTHVSHTLGNPAHPHQPLSISAGWWGGGGLHQSRPPPHGVPQGCWGVPALRSTITTSAKTCKAPREKSSVCGAGEQQRAGVGAGGSLHCTASGARRWPSPARQSWRHCGSATRPSKFLILNLNSCWKTLGGGAGGGAGCPEPMPAPALAPPAAVQATQCCRIPGCHHIFHHSPPTPVVPAPTGTPGAGWVGWRRADSQDTPLPPPLPGLGQGTTPGAAGSIPHTHPQQG